MDNSKIAIKEYIPYGDEWAKEMRKLPKDTLIDLLKMEWENQIVVVAEVDGIDKSQLVLTEERFEDMLMRAKRPDLLESYIDFKNAIHQTLTNLYAKISVIANKAGGNHG